MRDLGAAWLAESDVFKALAAVRGVSPLAAATEWYAGLSPKDDRIERIQRQVAELSRPSAEPPALRPDPRVQALQEEARRLHSQLRQTQERLGEVEQRLG
jgi:hypothetical protein